MQLTNTHGWEVKLMLLNAIVTKVVLYRVEESGGTISLNAWNQIENI